MENKLLINERSKRFYSCPGSPIKEVYHGELNAAGDIELVSDGFENIQEYIDSFVEETNIENIITRVARGEIDLLNQRQGAYFDSVGMPKDYKEILNIVNNGKRYFDLLPIEIKEKFDNNFEKWFATAGEPDWFEKNTIQSNDDIKSDEVKE